MFQAADNFCPCRTFLLNRERAVDYLNMLDRLYVFDGYAGWDPEVSLPLCCHGAVHLSDILFIATVVLSSQALLLLLILAKDQVCTS